MFVIGGQTARPIDRTWHTDSSWPKERLSQSDKRGEAQRGTEATRLQYLL